MKFNTIIRINNSTEELEVKKLLVNTANENLTRNLKKGIRLMNGTVTLGLNGIDYVEDKYTALISFDSYKIPRIISNYFFKKITPDKSCA